MSKINVNDLTCIRRLEKITEPLTPQQFAGFLHNVQEERGDEPNGLEDLERYYAAGGFSAVLSVAFIWRKTPEGQDYWDQIYRQTKKSPAKFLTPLR